METGKEEDVATREELAAYVALLRGDLLTRPSGWETPTLEAYLEALSAWIEDMPGWFANRGETEPSQPTWTLGAHMLRAASMYE